MVIAIGGNNNFGLYMVNHSIRKLGDWQQPIKFKESILQQTKKTQALSLGFFLYK
jgi:hypothetical protein